MMNYRVLSCGFGHKTFENFHSFKSVNLSVGHHQGTVERGCSVGKPIYFSSRFCLVSALQSCSLVRARSFSSSYSQNVIEASSSEIRVGKALPWLASNRNEKSRRQEKGTKMKIERSSWEVSAERFRKNGRNSVKNTEKKTERSSWEVSADRFLKNGTNSVKSTEKKNERSSLEASADRFLKNGSNTLRNSESRTLENQRNYYVDKDEYFEGGGGEEVEVVDDPRWDNIKNRFNKAVDVKPWSDRPEFQKWNKQANWGRKTWKEATESTVPRMVGEGIYGVGPVLAALSAGRREFYALYVQEGLDLSGNNRKKKDKKGFERVLRIAEKIGLSKKEVSKHDLNMVVDNRPHQGLVLDASPLEMVGIKELDPVLTEGENGPLWVALDEVTDPQNLGAIVRSAYFFGASGIVLCAKNSAPLSGVVSKASAGSLELMELRSCKNMMQFLSSSAENGWRVLGGSVSSRAIPLNEIDPGTPTILVMGSEGTGLRPLVERSCTQLIRIPGNIPVDVSAGLDGSKIEENGCSSEEFRSFLAVESLNVSVAAGVLLHHLTGAVMDTNLGDRQTHVDSRGIASN